MARFGQQTFAIAVSFGNGDSVLTAESFTFQVRKNQRITGVSIRSTDKSGALLSGSITCDLYNHALSAGKGSIVDSFSLNSASNMSETGLNIPVNVDSWITIITSAITNCKQIVCSLHMETR